ncbi:uncharacterized protein CC84DRAFT_901679 [Paraphaeosphaeria sporulosa]|uniref:Uncharacterized protein n=1 Tax=Paraphaeosphaeria sporulosa TaxID=1460663 RepID=A0A177C757_9PLEO|nr:uncharacterized protein CC84DRAFT_901679 [Paraphaeosphaeria sporulosa]OAG02608.1 hypothetical protein CC84DRAFT_901679 [Paraphaeosphaeria sporulosa]
MPRILLSTLILQERAGLELVAKLDCMRREKYKLPFETDDKRWRPYVIDRIMELLELNTPNNFKAQDSFSSTVYYLKVMTLTQSRFPPGSQLSPTNHAKLLQKLESETRLRRSIREINFPEVTNYNAITMKLNPDGTKPVMDLKLDVIFNSIEDPMQSMHVMSQGHLAHDDKIANGTPKKSLKSILQPYAHAATWQGSITIEGHGMASHKNSIFGNALRDVGLGSPDHPTKNIPAI